MKKVSFKYKKDDGSQSERMILNPTYLKESSNSLREFDKPDVNYVNGFEFEKKGLSEEEISKYEKTMEEYFSKKFPTLKDYLDENGLDSSRVNQKSFKKLNISNFGNL